MSCTGKSSVTAFWILLMMSLFLWYRNERYDRTLSVFVFTLGIIQLIEYGVQSGANPNQSGRMLFITLWLQCLVLAIGIFIFITGSPNSDNTIISWNIGIFSVIFVIAIILSFTLEFTASIYCICLL
jgi:hypothetical protein